MPLDSTETVVDALRASGLLTRDQLRDLTRALATIDGPSAMLQSLVDGRHFTVYQLRKIIRGKAAELRVGPYVIADKIGGGGMGKVYRARDPRAGCDVALKMVRPKLLTNPVLRKRYEREVETALGLKHPNIVAVYDAGEDDGRFYLAMEFVDGIDLAQLVRQYRPLEVAEACEYARQAALGLHYAHEAGFVHRDVKPSNIVVAGERHVPQATEPAVVKLLDMGLIRTVGFDDGAIPGEELTRNGTVVGTPDYMAPEQAKNSSTVDHRADLYSLGCTLYFLLAGQTPFPDGTPIAKILNHLQDTPAPVQSLRPQVPAAVAQVVARLMAKKAEDRFATAREVAEVLEPLARHPQGSRPVPIRLRRDTGTVSAAETPSASGGSTVPPNQHAPAEVAAPRSPRAVWIAIAALVVSVVGAIVLAAAIR